jgi:hypothetical protein
MKMPFSISWEKITPAIAREFLSHNVKNRNLRRSTAVAYGRDMKAGEWLPNHQGIAFDKDGNLIDGQHRLVGVVISGATIYSLVARNVPTQIAGAAATTMDTIDRGAARSIADALQLGHGTVDALAVTAICNLIVMMAKRSTGNVPKGSMAQTLGVLELYKPHINFVITHRSKTNGLRSAPVMTAIAFARAVKVKAVEEFYHSLISGEGLMRDTPLLTIRNFLIDKKCFAKNGAERLNLIDAILTAIWLQMRGEKMSRVSARQEAIEFFRKPQAAAIDKIEELYPPMDNKKEIVALGELGKVTEK